MGLRAKWLQVADCRNDRGIIFKTLGLAEGRLPESKQILSLRCGMTSRWGGGRRAGLSVLSYEFPVAGCQCFPYFYCKEFDGVNVFLFFGGKAFLVYGLRVLGGGLGVDTGSLAYFWRKIFRRRWRCRIHGSFNTGLQGGLIPETALP